ncbi:MAG: 5-oxoprolinase subunit PxpB [Desulfobulbus sp.]|jgi:KipI family sensor histidine kinase inhibitor|uniref:5-oxoprolinase subunit PxpB n=1 Tax=Desulfobulbus sp. TaxID=895 RepID=UPI0028511E44|nr:5-oxoprolinase subunit PxpB [Desulfobulbus sp.]MDR2550169.1 5-oxoprolinase subunit PxpB [Desulfobulbus sp.]
MGNRDDTADNRPPAVRFRISGDRALIAVYGEGVDPAVNERVRRMAALIEAARHPAIEAVVPSYATLAIHYDPDLVEPAALGDLLRGLEALAEEATVPPATTIEIPVCYGGEFGPDLATVAAHNRLAPDEAIRLHSRTVYRIYAIGFTPGFCYLGGLDPRLHTPRLATPRQRVPAGSLGIAGGQTGIYPLASPGGWQLIGRTPLLLFDCHRTPPVPYRPGDAIRFRPISADAFYRLAGEAKR